MGANWLLVTGQGLIDFGAKRLVTTRCPSGESGCFQQLLVQRLRWSNLLENFLLSINVNGILTVPSSLSVNLPICGKSVNFSMQTTPVVCSLAIATLSCLMNLGLSFCLFPVFLSSNAIKCCKKYTKKCEINGELVCRCLSSSRLQLLCYEFFFIQLPFLLINNPFKLNISHQTLRGWVNCDVLWLYVHSPNRLFSAEKFQV